MDSSAGGQATGTANGARLGLFPGENPDATKLKEWLVGADALLSARGLEPLLHNEEPVALLAFKHKDLSAFPALAADNPGFAAREALRAQIVWDNALKTEQKDKALLAWKVAWARDLAQSMATTAPTRLGVLQRKHQIAAKLPGTTDDVPWNHALARFDGIAMYADIHAILTDTDRDSDRIKAKRLFADFEKFVLPDGSSTQSFTALISIFQVRINPYLDAKYEGAALTRLIVSKMPPEQMSNGLQLLREFKRDGKMEDAGHVITECMSVMEPFVKVGVQPKLPQPAGAVQSGASKRAGAKAAKKARDAAAAAAANGRVATGKLPAGKKCSKGTCDFDHDSVKPGGPCYRDNNWTGPLAKPVSDAALQRINRDRKTNSLPPPQGLGQKYVPLSQPAAANAAVRVPLPAESQGYDADSCDLFGDVPIGVVWTGFDAGLDSSHDVQMLDDAGLLSPVDSVCAEAEDVQLLGDGAVDIPPAPAGLFETPTRARAPPPPLPQGAPALVLPPDVASAAEGAMGGDTVSGSEQPDDSESLADTDTSKPPPSSQEGGWGFSSLASMGGKLRAACAPLVHPMLGFIILLLTLAGVATAAGTVAGVGGEFGVLSSLVSVASAGTSGRMYLANAFGARSERAESSHAIPDLDFRWASTACAVTLMAIYGTLQFLAAIRMANVLTTIGQAAVATTATAARFVARIPRNLMRGGFAALRQLIIVTTVVAILSWVPMGGTVSPSMQAAVSRLPFQRHHGEILFASNAALSHLHGLTLMPGTLQPSDAVDVCAAARGMDAEQFRHVYDAGGIANAVRSLCIGDSGAGGHCLPKDCPFEIPGTRRANTQPISTANGITTPPFKCDAKIPVRTVKGSKRFLRLHDAIILEDCPHVLVSLGTLARAHNIGTWIAPGNATSYLAWRSKGVTHTAPLINMGVLVVPDAAHPPAPALGGVTHGSGAKTSDGGVCIHERFLHRRGEVLRDLPKCTNAPKEWTTAIDGIKDKPCHDCLRSTADAMGSKHHVPQATSPGEWQSFDIWKCGVPHVHGGQQLVMNFHDHYSKRNKPYLLDRYSDAPECMRKHLAYCAGDGVVCRNMHTDNGTTFVSAEMREILTSNKIKLSLIAPGTPRQNGMCERQWRSLARDTRNVTATSNLPRSYWWYAMRHAALVAAYLPIDGSPTECGISRWSGKPANVDTVRTFGCVVYPKIYDPISKVADQSMACIYLGRNLEQNGYMCLDVASKKIYTTPHCRFVESCRPGLTTRSDGTQSVEPPYAHPEGAQPQDGPGLDFGATDDGSEDDLADPDLDPAAGGAPVRTPPPEQPRPAAEPWNADRLTRRARAVPDGAYRNLAAPVGDFVLYLGSGVARPGDFAEHLAKLDIGVMCIDVKRGGYAHDLSSPDLTAELRAVAALPRCVGVLMSTPCGTFSVLRFNDGSAKVLRDRDHPAGIPDENGGLPASVTRANTITSNALSVCDVAFDHGKHVIIESPVPRGLGSQHAIAGREKHASMWDFPPMRAFETRAQCKYVDFDQCMMGATAVKTTRLMCTPYTYQALFEAFAPAVCDGKHEHVDLRQDPTTGEFRSSSAEQYPSRMNEALARVFNQAVATALATHSALGAWGVYMGRAVVHSVPYDASVHGLTSLAQLAAGGAASNSSDSDATRAAAALDQAPTPGLRAEWRDATPSGGTDVHAAPHSPRAVGALPPTGGLDFTRFENVVPFLDAYSAASGRGYSGDTPSYRETLTSPDAADWAKSRESEVGNLERHGVFVEVPEDSLATWNHTKRCAFEVVDTIWVFLRKRDGAGRVTRHKARVCLRGDQQKWKAKAISGGVDLDTFAPAVRHTTYKTLCATGCMRGARKRTFDVEAAFLQGEFKENQKVYARPPPGFRTVDERGVPIVWLLQRPLYGAGDAAKCWYETLTAKLFELGMERSRYDPCLFYKVYKDGGRLDMSVYVDDSWCNSTAGAQADADLAALSRHFTLTINDTPEYFLGMNVTQHSNTSLTLDMRAYVLKLVEKYLPSTTAAAVRTPADRSLHQAYEEALRRETVCTKAATSEYMSTVGALIYTNACRADVAHAVNMCARALTFPTDLLKACAHRVIHYLRGNPTVGITFDGKCDHALVAYSDSDWSTAQSTSGWCVMLAGAAVAWESKRQQCVALSSTEAEIIAASRAALEVVYLRGLMTELGFPPEGPTVLYVDNTGAVELSRNPSSCQRSRHVERRFLKVRELVALGEIEVRFVATAENRADVLTKSTLDVPTFRKHTGSIMNYQWK